MSLPVFESARPKDRRGFVRDIQAGLGLAALAIPEVMGYTRIAAMPAVAGLYTLLLPPLAFAAFGSSRHLVIGADSATAAIMAGTLVAMATPGTVHYGMLAASLALMVAGLMLLSRLFKLGFLADFLSRTVLTGFLTGVGVQVSVAMLPEMLGVEVPRGRSFDVLVHLAGRLGEIHAPTAALAGAVTVILLLARRFAPRAPIPLAVIVGAISASAVFGFARFGIATLAPVPGGLPHWMIPLPALHEIVALAPVAGACFVVILAQSAATARAYAVRFGEDLDEDADLIGLAAGNLAAALSGTFLVNGSPTKTAMAAAAGSRTQFAQIILCAVVLVVLVALAGPLHFLPRCILAAVVLTIGVGMVDIAGLRDIGRESPGEMHLALLTAAAVVLIGVEQGILLAMFLSLVRHLRHSYRPHSTVLAPDAAGALEPVPALPGAETTPGLIVYRFGAQLYYANADAFAAQVRLLLAKAPHPVRTLILDAGATISIDYSAAATVRDLLAELRGRGVRVIYARVDPYLMADLRRHRLLDGPDAPPAYQSLREALGAADVGGPPGAAPRADYF